MADIYPSIDIAGEVQRFFTSVSSMTSGAHKTTGTPSGPRRGKMLDATTLAMPEAGHSALSEHNDSWVQRAERERHGGATWMKGQSASKNNSDSMCGDGVNAASATAPGMAQNEQGMSQNHSVRNTRAMGSASSNESTINLLQAQNVQSVPLPIKSQNLFHVCVKIFSVWPAKCTCISS